MHHPDDVLRFTPIDRQAGVGRLQRLIHELTGGQVGVQHGDGLAVDHHLGDVHVGEIEHAAEHPPVAALHQPFGVVVFHRAPDLLLRRAGVGGGRDVEPEQLQPLTDHPLDGADQRPEHPHDQKDGRREKTRGLFRPADGQGLGQDLGVDKNQRGGDHRGDDDAPRAGKNLGADLGQQRR